jgi:hypothetical protein
MVPTNGAIRRAGFPALAFIALLIVPGILTAQDSPSGEFVIEDNSFLIEEAYNQESGVIQHISNFVHVSPLSEGEFAYSLTEEWPITGQDHQLGFTFLFNKWGDRGRDGVGDLLVNYRYQLSRGPVAVAPRFSLIIPTGDEASGNGSGVVGYQFNLPVSARLSKAFVGHFNAGAIVLPGVKGEDGATETIPAWLAGGSLIWLTTPRLNFHLEALLVNEGEIGPSGGVDRWTEVIVNPAFRYAVDFGSLQVVPGFGVPVVLREGAEPAVSFFLYLSLEHPFSLFGEVGE